MKSFLYTCGYNSAAAMAAMSELMKSPDAVLLDVRFSAQGRPGTRQSDWQRRFGRQYAWVKALGNETYKTSKTTIHNPTEGIKLVRMLLDAGKTVILLCACASHAHCHRTVAAEMIRDAYDGELEIVHLPNDATREKPSASGPGLFE